MIESLHNFIGDTTAMVCIIIKSVSEKGRTILIIAGNNDAATLNASYR
ncbi:MAG: hypothetical protein ACI9DJ_001054 [Algoriphagus sp.]|jgi:hypothetical protein